MSRSRPPAAATFLADRLGGVKVEMGSAGAKAMAVVRGEADVYAHSGGQYEWDSCAPVAVALAAGLHASRIDGSPLVYNQAEPYLPDLLICRRELAEPALAALTEFGPTTPHVASRLVHAPTSTQRASRRAVMMSAACMRTFTRP